MTPQEIANEWGADLAPLVLRAMQAKQPACDDPFPSESYPCECGRGPILPGNMVPEVCADCYAERFCAECGEPMSVAPGRACKPAATVKRATLFDGIVDTYQTETELNGFRPTQGAML